jgi:hypothetical protein
MGCCSILPTPTGKKISDSVLLPVDFGTVAPLEQVTQYEFQDPLYNRQANRSVDPGDVSQRLVMSALYELPFGRGKRWNPANGVLSKIVGGWQINLIGVMQSGIPLTVRGANNFQADRPNSTGISVELRGDQRGVARWFDTAQFVNPPDFTFGNVSRTIPDVRHPGTVNLDASLIKDTHITERLRSSFVSRPLTSRTMSTWGWSTTRFRRDPTVEMPVRSSGQSHLPGTRASCSLD